MKQRLFFCHPIWKNDGGTINAVKELLLCLGHRLGWASLGVVGAAKASREQM